MNLLIIKHSKKSKSKIDLPWVTANNVNEQNLLYEIPIMINYVNLFLESLNVHRTEI